MEQMSVILPAYNEEKGILKTLEEVSKFIKENKGYDFIFVNDGSKDDTAKIIKEYIKENKTKNLSLLSYQPNKGKGNAVKAGVFKSDSGFISFLDSDLAYSLEHLHIIRKALENSDVAIGSRKLFNDNFRRTRFSRVFIGKTFNLLVKIFLGLGYPDTQAGVKGFRKEAAKKIFKKQSIDGWGFDVELLFLAKRYGFKIKEIPAKLSTKHINQDSRVSVLKDSIMMFGDLFKIRINSIIGKYGQ